MKEIDFENINVETFWFNNGPGSCYKSMPCQHEVKYETKDGEKKEELWFSSTIGKFLKKYEITIPSGEGKLPEYHFMRQ